EAILVGKKCTVDFPGFLQSWAYLGRAYSESGNAHAAIDAFTRSEAGAPEAVRPILDSWLAYAYARAGETAKAAAMADRLRQMGSRANPYYLSYPYIALGRRDEAID